MQAKDIMHPEDARTIGLIKSVPGCEELIRTFMELGYETQYRGENLANSVRVTTESFPKVYALFREVVKKTGIKEPELYIYNDPVLNAYTYGETNTFIAVSSGLVETMNDKELQAVMAHECGHILCKHTLYKTILHTLQDLGFVSGAIPRTMLGPLYLALQYWSRKGELSADRCGAAVMGEEVYQSALLKMASGLKRTDSQSRELVEQGKKYEAFKRSSLWNRIQQESRCIFYSHPQLCTRALELDYWKDSYGYRTVRATVKY